MLYKKRKWRKKRQLFLLRIFPLGGLIIAEEAKVVEREEGLREKEENKIEEKEGSGKRR